MVERIVDPFLCLHVRQGKQECQGNAHFRTGPKRSASKQERNRSTPMVQSGIDPSCTRSAGRRVASGQQSMWLQRILLAYCLRRSSSIAKARNVPLYTVAAVLHPAYRCARKKRAVETETTVTRIS